MPLLEIDRLKTWYPVKGGSLFSPSRYVKALDGVSFDIASGETLGLVGESGCGKSTLGRTLIRLEKPTDGSFKLNGKDITNVKGRELRAMRSKIQMIFQDPYGSLNPRMTVFRVLDEVLFFHSKLDADQRHCRIVELLELVGLRPEHMQRYPHQFSGGQRQRIGIARALAVQPELIIADEPVSALDVSVQAQIINLLKEIQDNTGISYLFIAHDLAVVEHISSRILVMYLGRIVESGPAQTICADTAHPYTKALLSAVPSLEPETRGRRIVLSGDVPSPINPPSGCAFHPRCPVAEERCRIETPVLAKVDRNKDHMTACFFPDKVGVAM